MEVAAATEVAEGDATASALRVMRLRGPPRWDAAARLPREMWLRTLPRAMRQRAREGYAAEGCRGGMRLRGLPNNSARSSWLVRWLKLWCRRGRCCRTTVSVQFVVFLPGLRRFERLTCSTITCAFNLSYSSEDYDDLNAVLDGYDDLND